MEIQSVEDLRESQVGFARIFGTIFLKFSKILEPLQQQLYKIKRMDQLSYWIYSANMKMSAKQFTAVALGASLFAFFLGIVLTTFYFATVDAPILNKIILSILLPFGLAFVVFAVVMMMPKNAIYWQKKSS